MWGVYRTKLKRTQTEETSKERYEDPSDEESRSLNRELQAPLRDDIDRAGEGELQRWVEKFSTAAKNTLRIKPNDQGPKPMSVVVKNILERRARHIRENDDDATKAATKEFKKQVRKEKRDNMLQEIDEAINEKNKWEALRKMKKDYAPNPYTIKDKDGRHVTQKNKAQAKAEYLAEKQWGHQAGELEEEDSEQKRAEQTNTRNICKDRYRRKSRDMNITYDKNMFTLTELKLIIKALRKGKATGPDGIQIEIIKTLNEENLKTILQLINTWWTTQATPEELTQAEVVSLYKKGDTANLENYRPISLLNTIYKIYAALIKGRIEKGVEGLLHKTQFGFRKIGEPATPSTASDAFKNTKSKTTENACSYS